MLGRRQERGWRGCGRSPARFSGGISFCQEGAPIGTSEKLGYFQAKDVAAPKGGRTEHSITLRMRREAQLRVLDFWGKEIRDYTLTTLYAAPLQTQRTGARS